VIKAEPRKTRRAAVAAMLLGDGCISQNGTMKITHCLRHAEYLEYKRDLLQQNQVPPIVINSFNNNGYPAVRLETRSRPVYRILGKRFYKNRQRFVTREFLDYLDERALAIWFQDDGSLSPKKRNGKIHSFELTLNTYLPLEQNEVILNYFNETWEINWTITKGKGKTRLRMGAKEGRKFVQLIEPYVVPCMRYKINPLCS
jgi:hypothetical protein